MEIFSCVRKRRERAPQVVPAQPWHSQLYRGRLQVALHDSVLANRLAAVAGEYRILGTDPAARFAVPDSSLITHAGTGTLRRLAFALTDPHTFLYYCSRTPAMNGGSNSASMITEPR